MNHACPNPSAIPGAPAHLPGIVFLVLLAASLAAQALEPSTPLANYGRQSWAMENGLPQNTVQALAQSKDGFLWIGTEVGLVRFDGTAFTVFDRNSSPALPSGDIRCLLAANDGSLWVGTSEGLARLRDGTVSEFTTSDGLPANSIKSLRLDASGNLTVSTESGDAGIEGSRFVPLVNEKLQSPTVTYSFDFADGTEMTLNKSSLQVSRKGHDSHREWLVGRDLPGSRIQVAQTDRHGSLWIGTNAGLVRWLNGKLQQFPITDPLSTTSILSIIEDREGDLWVGTETSGLHILRDQRFRTIGMHDGLPSDATTAVVEDASGRLWIGTAGFGLGSLPGTGPGSLPGTGPGNAVTYNVRKGLLSDVVLSLAAAPSGDLWVGTPDGLSRIRRGQIDSFTSADGLPDDFIRSLLADPDGSLWIGTRRGLTHWLGARTGSTAPSKMVTYTRTSGLGSDLVGAMVHDSTGDLWVATYAGLSRVRNNKIENYTTANGLSSNVITALLPLPNSKLLIGTQDRGWSFWDGRRFSVPDHSGTGRAAIHAILGDSTGHVWFASDGGIARSEMDSAGNCSHFVDFTTADGLRSRETATNSHPSAWRSRSGLLWFATPKGLVEVDPSHFPVNNVPPPVAITRFAVDDLSRTAGSWSKIEAGHVHFEFDYAALSFVAPQKVRYRYMLDGFDRGWTDAGPRRTAYYTNIPPGRYTFRVQAANNDGLWNIAGTALAFELRPRFYQTVWFYLLLIAAIMGLVVLFLRRRLGIAQREFAAVLRERIRIAREIHDTLAQGYVGISLQLEVLAELLRHRKLDDAQKHLDTTRSYVRQGLADARQSIWALRSQDSEESTLPIRLRRIVSEAEAISGFQCNFRAFGAYHPLPPSVEREILRIAQEAIQNVKKHAGAASLVVQIDYGADDLALEVRDDGRGFADPPGSGDGHFGLAGMQERAAGIGGTLEVTSEPGCGTAVRLRIPTPPEQQLKPEEVR